MSDLEKAVIAAIRTVQDPELPVNLYDLGLIYDLQLGEGGDVVVRMTLTTPNCPVAESMPGQVQQAVESVDGVHGARVELVWEPPWTSEMMSEEARMTLEMMGISWSDTRGGPATTPLTFGRSNEKRGRES
jgi:FeS assembly SUF system protein